MSWHGVVTLLQESLDPASGFPGGLETLAVGFAAVAFLNADLERASKLLSWVRARTFTVGRVIPSPSAYALYRHYVGLVRAGLDPRVAHRCRDEGRRLSESEALTHLGDPSAPLASA